MVNEICISSRAVSSREIEYLPVQVVAGDGLQGHDVRVLAKRVVRQEDWSVRRAKLHW